MRSMSWIVALLCLLAEERAAAQSPPELRVPEGFIIEPVAGPGLVERPMLASLDDAGRLYVADSAGVNRRGPELAADPPHVIRLLEDADGDGRFDTSRVWADKLVFPQGVLCHDGAVYCASPPSFWRLADRDGDGLCDERTELVTGFANTGVADDLHGASLGLDGRIYWCAGRFPHAIRTAEGALIHRGTAPLILRCRPGGGDVEVVCGAQGNAVGVAFLPSGDMFASGTYLAPESMGADLRDAVIHAIDGAEYPVRDRVLNEHKRTGELLPPLVHLGFAAASDLAAYEGPQFGDAYRGNLFVALFNMHKVVRLRLEPRGASYVARIEDFLTTEASDFHPTDVLEDADGSLLVLNTGGWFRIGCPTSQIARPEVLGGIYRIRRADAPRVDDPRGERLDWTRAAPADLAARLDDPRPAVRRRAMAHLARRGPDAAPALQAVLAGATPAARQLAVWSLSRIEGPAAREPIRAALADPEAGVRQAAARAAGLWRDAAAAPALEQMVRRDAPPVRREAATALGRMPHGGPSTVGALLAGLADAGEDRFLEHAIVFALITRNQRESTRAGLASPNPAIQRGALLALDQMDDGDLGALAALPLLESEAAPLRDAALWVVRRHPDWGADVAPLLAQWLAESPPSRSPDALRETIHALAGSEPVQQAVAARLADPATPQAMRLLLLAAVGEAPLDKMPLAWSREVAAALDSSDEEIVRQALETLRTAPPDRRPTLERIDATIDFSAAEGPWPGTALEDYFCVQWSGVLEIEHEGDYTFHLESDDGSWLFLDDRLVIDNGGKHAVERKTATVRLAAGRHAVRIDYQEFDGGATCRWLWERQGREEPVPTALAGRYFSVPRMGRAFPDLTFTDYDPPLARLVEAGRRRLDVRVTAAALLTPQARHTAFELLVAGLADEQAPLTRLLAADALASGAWDAPQRSRLAELAGGAGPLELPKLLPAFESGGDEELGQLLLARLQSNPAAESIRPDLVRRALEKFPEATRRAGEEWLARIAPSTADRAARLAELASALAEGEVQRGRDAFFSAKAACSACHQVQGQGGRIGPDLSRIGAVRAEADLLESIVYPSSSFARGFEPYSITTHDGQLVQGVIRRQTSDAVYVYNSLRVETRVSHAAIDELAESTVSIMPDGLDKQLSAAEIADLVAFLRSLR